YTNKANKIHKRYTQYQEITSLYLIWSKENLEQYQILDLFSHCQARSMFDQLFDLKTKSLTKFNNLNTTLIGNNIDLKRNWGKVMQPLIDHYGEILFLQNINNNNKA
ncbi:hypothetical protein HID58_006716, partial [Brassica napus]